MQSGTGGSQGAEVLFATPLSAAIAVALHGINFQSLGEIVELGFC